MIEAALVAAVIASAVFWLTADACARRALAPRAGVPAAAPAVSILKPVCGLDFEARANFVSHCEQRYAAYEVVFGVADRRDPAVPLIEALHRRYGDDRVRLVVAPSRTPNPKAGLLDELARQARHDVLVTTDSDVRLPPDALARTVEWLADPGVGLVTLPYRGDRVLGLAAALEALGITTAFLPAALVGRRVLRARYAFGAANALRRDTLDRIGGFRAVASYLADDYQLGYRIGAAGLRVELGDTVVASVLGPSSLGDWWHREVRWARGIRASRRAQYPGLVLTFTTPLALGAALAGAGWLPLVGALAVRWLVAARMTRWAGDPGLRRWLWLVPVRDLLAPAIWCAGLIGRRVRWRGRTYRIAGDGRLHPPVRGATEGVIEGVIRRLDHHLRRRRGIFEFTDDPACVLRLAIARDAAGAPIGELHFWNEQMPATAFALDRRLHRSLVLLARFVAGRPELAGLRRFVADSFLDARYPVARLDRLARRYGLCATGVDDRGLRAGWARWSQAFHTRLIRRAFPGCDRGDRRLQWIRFSISRDELLARYPVED
ncbi:MAG TPA: bacteriohopanetetrol glucosamine biosynthesis glycosyltransferase HpnI [Kofleriaceae bacterium]|nr:bacteriohopanetetrol glucosamine biosynthesis glycosyltransferase HpnI [Kofleriaceae bacterium]